VTSREAASPHTARLAPGERSLGDLVRQSGLRSLVLGLSKDPNAKVTLILVSPRSGRAVLAVKVPTTDAAARAVEAEARTLEQVHSLAPRQALATVPRVVETVRYEGRPAMVTTAVPGTPLTVSYMSWRHTASRSRAAGDFEAVGSWLADLQHGTERGESPLDMDGGVRQRLADRFPADPQLAEDMDRLEEIHGRLSADTTPQTVVHGDLWLGNVLMTRGRATGVVDWEAGAPSGEPVRDLVRFSHMYGLYLDRRTRRGHRVAGHNGLRADGFGAGLQYALDGTGWFPELLRGFLGDGLARLGASPAAWRDAAVAGIAEVAAVTDDDRFARLHLELFRRVTRRSSCRKDLF
jgi:aminoglycoside phosphotransferase (APT) family kinase protein